MLEAAAVHPPDEAEDDKPERRVGVAHAEEEKKDGLEDELGFEAEGLECAFGGLLSCASSLLERAWSHVC